MPFTMAKRRKLDLSCNYYEGEGSSSVLGEISSPVGLPVSRRIRSQITRLSPAPCRSRYHSDNVTDALRQIGCGTESSSVLGLQLQELLEKARRTAQARMTNAQDALQELRRIIEQIPPRERMRVSVESSLVLLYSANMPIC